MALTNKILNLFDKPNCFFYQDKKCILHNRSCLLCSSHIQKIEGIDNTSEYLNFITNKKNNRTTIFLTSISLVFSLTAIYLTVFKDEVKQSIGNGQLPTTNIGHLADSTKNDVYYINQHFE